MNELSRRHLMSGAIAVSTAAALSPFVVQPARAAAPLAGKQNAGWYRFKLGDFEVTVVTDGSNNNPLPDGYVANQPKAAVNGALEADFLPKDRVIGMYTPVVVNTGSKLVAIDTGLGLGMFAQSKGAVGQYHSNLEAAGINRNAVDIVIISHFHGDHINGLVGPENKPAFPNAEIIVPESEYAFWTDESNASKLPEVARGQIGNVKRVMGVLGNKVTRHAPDKELAPGITAIATPGHTPGHTSHMIASGSSKLLVQADVTAGAASIFSRNPEWQFVFDTDKAQAVATRKRIYDMAVTDRIPVHGYHFAFPSLSYIEKSGGGYRLTPMPWSPTI